MAVGIGDERLSPFQDSTADALSRSMTNYNVGSKPTLKGNLCLLLLIALAASASIFAFVK
jgi:hypothetical protein